MPHSLPRLARLYGFHWQYAYAVLSSLFAILLLFVIAYWTSSEQDRTTKLVYTNPKTTYYVDWPIVQNRPVLYGPQLRAWTSEPSLPPGLILDQETGVLSGTPMAPQPRQTFEVRATMPSGAFVTTTLDLQILALALV